MNDDTNTPTPAGGSDLVTNPIASVTEEPNSRQVHQTVEFSETQNVYTVDASATRDETYHIGSTEDAPLGEFLGRPISLQTVTWPTYTPQRTNFDPWVMAVGHASHPQAV